MIRLLIATDAWRPQVNGVVRSIETAGGGAAAAGRRGDGPVARLVPHGAAADLQGNPPGDRPAVDLRPPYRGRQAGRHPHRHRGAGRLRRAPLVPAQSPPLHHQLSHALSRIYRQAGADPARLDLFGAAPLPQCRQRLHGRHADAPRASLPGAASTISCTGRAASTATCSARARMRACRSPGPIFLYVGRIAVEKNLEAFLDLDLPGSKVVVGDGPDLARLKAAYPRRAFPRRDDRRGPGQRLCRRRRLRLPQPHRHLRHGAARGAGRGRCRSPPIRCRGRST